MAELADALDLKFSSLFKSVSSSLTASKEKWGEVCKVKEGKNKFLYDKRLSVFDIKMYSWKKKMSLILAQSER